jgi:hypothetical protein
MVKSEIDSLDKSAYYLVWIKDPIGEDDDNFETFPTIIHWETYLGVSQWASIADWALSQSDWDNIVSIKKLDEPEA